MKTIAKIIRELEKVNTPEEWNDVYRAVNIIHGNFDKQQRIMRQNARKAELRKMAEVAKAQWKEGDRVKFYARKYYINCMGVIIKRNPKRAKIQVYVGKIKGVWAVPYGNLTKIVDNKEIAELAIGKMEG